MWKFSLTIYKVYVNLLLTNSCHLCYSIFHQTVAPARCVPIDQASSITWRPILFSGFLILLIFILTSLSIFSSTLPAGAAVLRKNSGHPCMLFLNREEFQASLYAFLYRGEFQASLYAFPYREEFHSTSCDRTASTNESESILREMANLGSIFSHWI